MSSKPTKHVLIRFSQDENGNAEANVPVINDDLNEVEMWRNRYVNQEGLAIYELMEP